VIYRFCRFLCWLAGKLLWRHRVVHPERLIESGGVLVVSNHASFLDPPMVGICFRGPMHFFARETLFRGPFAWLLPRLHCIPVGRGRAETASLRKALAVLQEGNRLLLFPEGTRSEDGNLIEPEPGVGFLIARCGVPVLPVRVFGAYEAYPRGAKFPKPGRVTVVVGEPVDFSAIPEEIKGRERYEAAARLVMEAIGRLRP